MALLKLYEYPHPVLKQKTEKVEKVDAKIQKLLDDMLETMYASNGCGLAAPQIGVSKKIVVIDIAHEDEEANPIYMVNPEIIWKSEEKVIILNILRDIKKCINARRPEGNKKELLEI